MLETIRRCAYTTRRGMSPFSFPAEAALEFAELAGAQSLVLDDGCGHLSAFTGCSGTAMTRAISAFLARKD